MIRKQLVVYLLAVALILLPSMALGQSQSPNPQAESRAAWGFYAFGYGNRALGTVAAGSTGTSNVTYTLASGTVTTPDGRTFVPYSVNNPVLISDANPETQTPSAVTGCVLNGPPNTCQLTFTTVTTAHGQGALIYSGSGGAAEAALDANNAGGGVVVADSAWANLNQGTTAMLQALFVYPRVSIMDTRVSGPVVWSPQGGLTTLALPTTLTAVTALPSATPVGAYGTGTYHMCIAYVDIMGQEGPCSADFSQAGLATGSFIFSAPAASAGAVGYTIYIGLTGGGVTNLDYKVPLVAQPTVIGAIPVANGVCTLTAIETTTPACAVTNTAYGQTGATATVTAITVNTSPINPQSTIISTTSIYVPNPGGRTTYVYAPSNHIGSGLLPTSILPFAIGAAAATTVPDVVGTVNIPPQFMNVLGRTLRICGEATTTASTATIVDIQFQWDAFGQNTAGKGVLIGDLTATPAAGLATTGHASFCQDFQTTVTSAAVTGGSINHINGWGGVGGVTAVAPGALSDSVTPGAIASLNLALDARINVIYLHQGSTDGAGWTLQNLSAEVIN